jgi:integrase
LKWLGNPAPDDATLKDFVMRMRTHGLKVSSWNCHIRAVNAYLRWARLGVTVSRLKEEASHSPTFSTADIQKLVRWKPKGFCPTRLHVMVLLLADTGCRSSETVRAPLGNLLLKLRDKRTARLLLV